MPIVAMTREMGALSNEVAEGLAQELSVPVVQHEIIDVLADKMRVRKSHVVRLLDGQASLFERMNADKTSMAIYTVAEIFNLATRGAGVILRGWGAVHVLRPVPHAVCVRICAPLELRKRRLMQRLKTDREDLVEKEIVASDEAQTAINRRNFHLDWTDATHYDLVLNTERVTVRQCIEEIVRLVRSSEFAENEASRQVLADLAMQAQVKAALRVDPTTRGLPVMVAAQNGQVTLTGIVPHADERSYVEGLVVKVVGGATEVINSISAEAELRLRRIV
jgi:cytidylate kinase